MCFHPGGIRCNPTAGYTEPVYQFYRSPQLKMSQTFTGKPGCATSHNPAVFMKEPVEEEAA